MAMNPQSRTMFGYWLLLASAVAGLLVSLYDYFWALGIDHTPGVLLVVISTALIVAASTVVAFHRTSPRWLRITLDVLILLGVVGTGAAAYFLEAHVLLALMVLGPIGWLASVVSPPRRRPAGLRQEYQGAVR